MLELKKKFRHQKCRHLMPWQVDCIWEKMLGEGNWLNMIHLAEKNFRSFLARWASPTLDLPLGLQSSLSVENEIKCWTFSAVLWLWAGSNQIQSHGLISGQFFSVLSFLDLDKLWKFLLHGISWSPPAVCADNSTLARFQFKMLGKSYSLLARRVQRVHVLLCCLWVIQDSESNHVVLEE